MIRTSMLGGTGHGGMELLRLLLPHPGVEVPIPDIAFDLDEPPGLGP